MIWAWREKLQRSMWPPTVVMGAVAGKDSPQVPFTEDQDAVGEFGSGGQDESFGEAVLPRTSRRDLDDVDPGAGQDGIKGGGELAGGGRKEGGAVVEVDQQVAGLLRGPAPVGWLVVPCRVPEPPSPPLSLVPPRPDHVAPDLTCQRITRRPILGGLISEYERAA